MDFKVQGQLVPVFIKPEDLYKYKSVKFIDVREPSAYAEGHLKNAVNAYDLFTYLLPTSTQEDIDQMKTYFQERLGQLGITGKEHVILYEQSMDKQYGASCRGFFILKYMKHPNVSTLEGGLDALIRIDSYAQQITKEPTSIITCKYDEQNANGISCQMAGRNEVLEVVNNKPSGTHLLDVRDADEWNGFVSSPYGVDFTPRKGRIPNSIWIEWYEFHELDSDKNMAKLKSNEEIQSLMKAKSIQKNDEIIIYCFKGSRAAVALMSLQQAGYTNVKNYLASWNEWSRDLELPIDDRVYA